jgi:hypothetical protein
MVQHTVQHTVQHPAENPAMHYSTSHRRSNRRPVPLEVEKPEQHAQLFQEIHDLMEQSGQRPEIVPRHAVDCKQLVAPYYGGPLPAQDQFQLVNVRELSSTGFTFLSKLFPDYRFVVIALGQIPFKFLVAELGNNYLDREQGQFVVQCTFVRRVM